MAREVAKLSYGVFPLEDQWRLYCQAYQLGRFRNQAEAISAGKRAVCEAMGSGFDAELLIVDVGGELRRADPGSIGH